jgi:hypothetical protein
VDRSRDRAVFKMLEVQFGLPPPAILAPVGECLGVRNKMKPPMEVCGAT